MRQQHCDPYSHPLITPPHHHLPSRATCCRPPLHLCWARSLLTSSATTSLLCSLIQSSISTEVSSRPRHTTASTLNFARPLTAPATPCSCTDAYQPHLACCFTLNQAHQLIHRINQQLSFTPNSTPSAATTVPQPTSYLYAYHIGSGVGRLASYADGPHPGAGERLLYQLQSTHTSNLILLVTCNSIGSTISGGGVSREAEVASERVTCVVRVAKGLLREWKRCVRELQTEETTSEQSTDIDKEGGWEQKDNPSALNDDSLSTVPTITFITQSPEGEEKGDETATEAAERVTECALPLSYPLIPRLTHTARLNHYLYTISTSLPAIGPPPPPRTTPAVVYWTLPSLRADVLTVLFPSVQPTTTSSFLSSASVLAVRWQLLPCLEHEREWMVNEEVWEGVSDWLDKETAADRVLQQWVEGSWSTVRQSVWDVYVRQMKFMHSTYRQADMEAMATVDTPPLILRLLLLAVGGVLGWPQLQWLDVVPYLTGLRAVPPQDIFAEFPPPLGPLPSAPAPPPSSVTTPFVQPIPAVGPSPYEHSHVVTSPLLAHNALLASVRAPATDTFASGDSSLASGTSLLRYSSYRSDLFANLLSFNLFTLSSSTLQRVQSVLCEHALAPSELLTLDRVMPGSRWLVQWLVLVVRCNRLWQLSRQVFKVQVEDEIEQADSTSSDRAAGTERSTRCAVRVGNVEIEHDSGEEEAKLAEDVLDTAFTDRGWTASRAASAL